MSMIAFCLIAGVAYSDGTDCADVYVLPPCVAEDSADCFWYAPERGNGRGDSFVDVDGLLFTWSGVIEGDL